MLSRPEILASEILALEIASDILGVPQETAFLGAGEAVVIPVVSQVVQTAFGAVGGATVSFAGQGVTPTESNSTGASIVDGQVDGIVQTTFAASGTASVVAHPGYVLATEFAAPGNSTAAFDASTDPGFDIHSHSSVDAHSAVVAGLLFDVQGASSSTADAQWVFIADFDSNGTAPVSAHAQTVSATTAATYADSQAAFAGESTANTTALASGTSAVAGRGQAAVSADFEAEGEAQTGFDVTFRTYVDAQTSMAGVSQMAFSISPMIRSATEYTVAGEANVGVDIQALRWIAFSGHGESEVLFRRGREVQPFLETAFEAVERPEETRIAEWS